MNYKLFSTVIINGHLVRINPTSLEVKKELAKKEVKELEASYKHVIRETLAATKFDLSVDTVMLNVQLRKEA